MPSKNGGEIIISIRIAQLETAKMTEEKSAINSLTAVLRGKEISLPGNLFVHQALKRMGLNSESVLVVRDGEVITEDTLLRPGDTIRIVPVISGGSDTP